MSPAGVSQASGYPRRSFPRGNSDVCVQKTMDRVDMEEAIASRKVHGLDQGYSRGPCGQSEKPSSVVSQASPPILILPDLPPSDAFLSSGRNATPKRCRAEYDEMAVVDLKYEIHKRGLDCLFCFSKEDLILRLLESDSNT